MGRRVEFNLDRSRAGLALKPSADGVIETALRSDVRAVLVWECGALIRIERNGRRETWARRFWIPLRGNRQWQRRSTLPPSPGGAKE